MTALEVSIRRALEAGELRVSEIAAHFGVARETVSRIRSRLRREAAAAHPEQLAGGGER